MGGRCKSMYYMICSLVDVVQIFTVCHSRKRLPNRIGLSGNLAQLEQSIRLSTGDRFEICSLLLIFAHLCCLLFHL